MTDDTYPKWAWKDGSFIPYDDCTVHVRTQAVMVAASVFEGIKGFWNNSSKSIYLFRLAEHIQRLHESVKMMRMNVKVPADLDLICAELIMRNGFTGDVHMMPTAYVGEGRGNVALAQATSEGMFITGVSRPRSAFLDKGLRVCVSSWTRIADNSIPPRIKAAGNYQNGRLALNEAWANGFDNCILLNQAGNVSEGPGACVMMVRNGQICTPPVTAGILESITRATLMTLFQEKMGMTVIERPIDRTELYTAEEVLMCGSGMDVVPVISVDKIVVGNGEKGPLTQAIQDAYYGVGTGEDPEHPEWRTAVGVTSSL
jgi:branched-chain amino acid aminotransferase group I